MKSTEKSIDRKAGQIIQKRKQRTRIITSVAACFLLVICAAVITPQLINNNPVVDNPGNIGVNPTDSIASSPDIQVTQENPVTTDAAPVIYMNTISEVGGAARLYFDPENTYEEMWDWDRIVEYLGKDITPDYLMPGLTANPWLPEQNQRVIFNNDGTMAYDAIWLEYYTEYPYEDGSRAISGYTTGIQIIASKIGYSQDAIYVWSSERESLINDVAVRIGHSNVGYGGTFENPDFYYDMYVAEFSKDGISFQVVSSNVSEHEFIKMVESLTSR